MRTVASTPGELGSLGGLSAEDGTDRFTFLKVSAVMGEESVEARAGAG